MLVVCIFYFCLARLILSTCHCIIEIQIFWASLLWKRNEEPDLVNWFCRIWNLCDYFLQLSRRRELSTWLLWSYQSRKRLLILLVSWLQSCIRFRLVLHYFSTCFQEGMFLLLLVANLLHWITVSSHKWGGSFHNFKWKIPLSCGMDPCMSSYFFCYVTILVIVQ